MKNRILYSLFAVFLLSANSGFAQIRVQENIHDGRALVMLTPQYVFVKQLRVEYDRKLTNRHWITLAPHYVQDIEMYEKRQGFGLVATYKFFLKNNSQSYLGGGVQMTKNVLNSYALDDISQTDLWLHENNITQYGFNAVIGRYMRLYTNLYGDIYGGLGYRFSKITSSDGTINSFNTGFFDSGYSGLMLVLGIRIGVML